MLATRTRRPTARVDGGAGGQLQPHGRATDNQGITATSAPLSVTVNAPVAQLYFISHRSVEQPQSDYNGAGQLVWTWENVSPFGYNAPNETRRAWAISRAT